MACPVRSISSNYLPALAMSTRTFVSERIASIPEALVAIENDIDLSEIPLAYRNYDVCLAAIYKDPSCYVNCPPDLKWDPVLMVTACANYGQNIAWVPCLNQDLIDLALANCPEAEDLIPFNISPCLDDLEPIILSMKLIAQVA